MLANAAAIVKGNADLSFNQGLTPAPSVQPESDELARARAIAQRLGITNLTDDEYDLPTYMRRQQERDT